MSDARWDRRRYAFALPAAQIAQRPADRRDGSRLLVCDRDGLSHQRFADLPAQLRAGDLVVANDTRVVPSRLTGRRDTGAAVEILTVTPLAAPGEWTAAARPMAKLRDGERVALAGGLIATLLERRARPDDLAISRWRIDLADGRPAGVAEVAAAAAIPLPPYIERSGGPDGVDADRYQTVFAATGHAVAAPTAGLHFTPELLARLGDRGVAFATLRLGVGPGTFRPVTVDDVRDHRVAPERYIVPPMTWAAVRATRAAGGRVIAVGTTVARTLESLARVASPTLDGETSLVIVEPFDWRVVDLLLTNFHLPESSLLLLLGAFAGVDRTLAAYREAVAQGYRFYSYGDASLWTRG
jgi:S-adenosylmethionine:tRNA ribosyltransferase-isomerase